MNEFQTNKTRNLEDIIQAFSNHEYVGNTIYSDSKLLSGFPFIGHGNPNNNLESSCILAWCGFKRLKIVRSYIQYRKTHIMQTLEPEENTVLVINFCIYYVGLNTAPLFGDGLIEATVH
jgi:hypothetical protein